MRSRCAPPAWSGSGRTAGSSSPSINSSPAGSASPAGASHPPLEQAPLLAEHFLAQQRNRRTAVGQELVMEVMPQRLIVGRRRGTCARVLGDPVGAQLADHEFAQRVIQVRRIIGAARRLLAGVARILKGLLPE